MPLPIAPGCFLYVDPTGMASLPTFPLGAGGAGSRTVTLVNEPAFVGVTLTLQAVVATLALDLLLTNGVNIALGDVNG